MSYGFEKKRLLDERSENLKHRKPKNKKREWEEVRKNEGEGHIEIGSRCLKEKN
jgi:hypothetical protein